MALTDVKEAFRKADETGEPQEVLGDDGKRVMLIVCPKDKRPFPVESFVVAKTIHLDFLSPHEPDIELTCIVCGQPNCDLEATAYKITKSGGHSRVWIGKHTACEFRPAKSV